MNSAIKAIWQECINLGFPCNESDAHDIYLAAKKVWGAEQLKRSDLPKRRISANSLHIPVLYKGKKRFVSDIHFKDNNLCYLEKNKGIPVKINQLVKI